MKTQITIAHLTDVHLGPIAGFSPRYWNVKRLLGYANWLRNRRDAYQREVLDRIVADLMTQAPDHIAVTGDLVNIGLPQEHINALAWVESLGAAHAVSVIPGNHDIYSRLGGDPGTARWSAYMASCAQGAEHAGGDEDLGVSHRTAPGGGRRECAWVGSRPSTGRRATRLRTSGPIRCGGTRRR